MGVIEGSRSGRTAVRRPVMGVIERSRSGRTAVRFPVMGVICYNHCINPPFLRNNAYAHLSPANT